MSDMRQTSESVQRAVDQRVFLRGVGWSDYEALLAIRGESSVPRMSYLKGVLEFMSPSQDHEVLKTRIARLIEAWSEEVGIDLYGAGSWTVKKKLEERGAEPDECYVILPRDTSNLEAPEIAIEVVWTHGGLDKLEIWRKLGVKEVWQWKDGRLEFFVLQQDEFQSRSRSELLPQLDPALIERLMTSDDTQPEAVRKLRTAIRAET